MLLNVPEDVLGVVAPRSQSRTRWPPSCRWTDDKKNKPPAPLTGFALSICDSGDHVRATLVLGHADRILLEARRNEQLGLAFIARAVMERGAAWGGAE